MNKLKQLIAEGRAIFASVLCMPTKALAAVGLLSSLLLLAPSAWAVQPIASISDVKAQQRYPWNGKVDISYTASSVESAAHAAGYVPTLKVTAVDRSTTPWTTNFAAAAALSGDTSLTNGTHALVWDLDAQGLSLKSTNVVFSVSSETNDYLVVDLSAGPSATRYPVESFDKAQEGGWNQAVYKTSKLVLRRIPAGSVVTNTATQARIVIDKPYYCGIFPVTGVQYTNVVASTADPSGNTGGMAPVEKVSWNTIMGTGGFISNLDEKAGIGFDLPTEEQWEYACRAGTSTKYNYGDTADGDYMWYKDNSEETTHEVGTASGEVGAGGNAWGLYDMHGNVREWTLTLYNAQGARVVRGGSWGSGAGGCTSSYRSSNAPGSANYNGGFRLIRTLPTGN